MEKNQTRVALIVDHMIQMGELSYLHLVHEYLNVARI